MKKFETPVIDVMKLEVVDVITTSGGYDPGQGGMPVMPIGD